MKLSLAKCARLMTARSGRWPNDQWGQKKRLDCNCSDCRALEDKIDSQPFHVDITRGEGLDGGGYEVEIVDSPPPEFAEIYGGRKGYFCDGDLEYVVGSLRDLECDSGSVAWFASVHTSGEWPKVYGDHDGGWRRLQHEAWQADRDADCNCGSNGFGNDVPPGMYPDDRTHELAVCPDCAGRGYRNVPAYRIAIYGDPVETAEIIGGIIEAKINMEGEGEAEDHDCEIEGAIIWNRVFGYRDRQALVSKAKASCEIAFAIAWPAMIKRSEPCHDFDDDVSWTEAGCVDTPAGLYAYKIARFTPEEIAR